MRTRWRCYQPGMSIDIHAHCVPADTVELLLRDGAEVGIELDRDRRPVIDGRTLPMPIRKDLVDRSLRLAAMDRSGIETQVLSSWIDLTAYGLEADQGARWSRLMNEALAAEAATEPGRFLAMATVPLQSPEAAAAELEYAARELGMTGVEIATTVDGVDLVNADLDPFWSAAARLGSLVMLHPFAPLAGMDLSSHFLHNIIGRPAETTIAIARLLLSGVLARHPDLNICVVHGGGFLPYQIGRMQRGWEAKPAIVAPDLPTPPREAIRSLHFDTILHDPLALRYLIDLVGADRVLLGTDYPFEMGDPDPLGTIDMIPDLTETERLSITGANASRLLRTIR